MSINIHIPFSLSRIIIFGLLMRIVLSVCICWFYSNNNNNNNNNNN